MHLIVVCRDVPDDGHFGGMRDVLTRYGHAESAGHSVTYVGFQRSGPLGDTNLRRRRWPVAIANALAGRPLQVGLRWPDKARLAQVTSYLRRKDDAAIVLAEQFVALPAAARIAEAIQVPLIYRSQNDEAAYARYVASCETGPRSWVSHLEARLVSRFIGKLEQWDLSGVLHISPDSAGSLDSLTRTGRSWLVPPTVPARPQDLPGEMERQFVVGYLGTFDLPQNAMELQTFLEGPWRAVRATLGPIVSLRVAGRGSGDLAARLEAALLDGVELFGEYDSPAEAMAGVSVAVNPALGGSGVSIKTLEYLAAAVPVAATPAGLRGLAIPRSVCSADQPIDEQIIDLISDPDRLRSISARTRDWYHLEMSPTAILDPLWAELEEMARPPS